MGVYDYQNKAILSLPMRIGEHDATNTRTLDVSPSGIHAGYTAGATAPTKNANQRGYLFTAASSQKFTGLAQGRFNQSRIAMCAVFNPSVAATEAVGRHIIDTSGGSQYTINRHATGFIYVNMGNTGVLSSALASWQNYWYQGCYNTIIATGTSGDNELLLNGVSVATSATAWAAANPDSYWIGCRRDLADFWSGYMYLFEIFPIRMTRIQALDWSTNALRRLNDV